MTTVTLNDNTWAPISRRTADFLYTTYGRSPQPRLGNIADRMTAPQGFDSVNKEASFVAWVPIPGGFYGPMSTFLPNAFIQGGTIFGGNGGSTTFTGSIEYRNGTRQQMKFGGTASVTSATPSIVEVDSMNLDVAPEDGGVFVHIHVANPNGVPYSIATIGSSLLGDGAVFSTTTTPDVTMTGRPAFASGYTFRPCAMVGMTKTKSILFLGDSIDKGQGPPGPDRYGHNGIMERALCGDMVGINISSPGGTAQVLAAMTSTTGFGVLWKYCQLAQLGAGTNDIFLSSRTAAQVIADTATLGGRLTVAGLVWGCRTALPRPSGGVVQAGEAEKVLWNNAVRALGVTGMSWYADPASVVENTYNGGLWKETAMAADEIHPANYGMSLIQFSGCVPIAFVRGLGG